MRWGGWRAAIPLFVGVLALAGLPAPRQAASKSGDDSHQAEILRWRAEREAGLRSRTGWLSIAGLFWLREGENRFGSGPSNEIVLPSDAAPAEVGVFTLRAGDGGDVITVRGAPGVDLGPERALRTDAQGGADTLRVGRLSLWIIHRGERFAVRMRDPESPLLRDFQGIDFFPVDARFRVLAQYDRFDPPRRILIPDILGNADSSICPGRIRFVLDGSEYSLYPLGAPSDSSLFLIFKDKTSGQETYGGGRFLVADVQPDGRVLVDFNRAYNPPCAYNPYTTCPLPPAENDLSVAIEAGEKTYGH